MNNLPLTKSSIFKLLKKISPLNLGKEKILLEKTMERFLHQDIISKINLPPFNNSAVDGYALVKDNINNKKLNLTFKQRLVAGDEGSYILKKDFTARIFTGAKMPLNSKTVVMQENVTVVKNNIIINKMPKYGENCRLAGEDIFKGQKIMVSGNKINSTNINLIAAIGKKNIFVKKKINIGFYTSGDELTKPTENLKGSQINNSNYYSLKVLLDKPFIKSKYLGVLKDKKKIVKESLFKNIKKYNVIITTGGASVGEEDHLIQCIKEMGSIYFWKAAIKPGRPLAIGKIKQTLIICLPGNPVSVHLLYGMIIKPFLEYLCSGKLLIPKGILARADFSMKKKNKRLEWLRVKIIKNKKNLIVNKYKKQGSGMISSMVFADGIIEIPENIRLIKKNDYFEFFSFENLFN